MLEKGFWGRVLEFSRWKRRGLKGPPSKRNPGQRTAFSLVYVDTSSF